MTCPSRSGLRRGKNTRHLPTGLLRQSVHGRLAGYEDVNDAERLSRDPAMRTIVDPKGFDNRAASTSHGRPATPPYWAGPVTQSRTGLHEVRRMT